MGDEPVVPALIGPTGVGKSAISLEVAEQLDAEIVAVDAFTVYRGMDIGTAKPTAAEQTRVRHHLVDVLAPSEICTVEWFQSAARAAIDDVLARGRVPLLVGGSGLYFRAVVDPLEFPPTDPAVRAEIAGRYVHDPSQAHRDLAAVDPDAAQRIDPANVRRSVRALEVIALTGRPFSDWRRAWEDYASVYPGLRVVGVAIDRADLAHRIDQRVDAMLAAGWVEECERLRTQELSATARQAIGYGELFAHLDGQITIEDAAEQIKVRTRQFATRQDRWFRRDPRVEWVAADLAPDQLRTRCTF